MSLGTAGSARGHQSGRSAAWLARLVRDQEVDGSNPFAPTTSFRANNLQQRKAPTTSWLCAKRSVVQMSSPNDLISLCKLELSGVTLRLHFPHFVAHVAQTGRASAWAG